MPNLKQSIDREKENVADSGKPVLVQSPRKQRGLVIFPIGQFDPEPLVSFNAFRSTASIIPNRGSPIARSWRWVGKVSASHGGRLENNRTAIAPIPWFPGL
jgi:hypothetical protein